MNEMNKQFIEELCGVVGSEHVQVSGDLSAYEQDWRRRSRGRALAVVRPKNTGEVSAIVKLCTRHGVAIVPQSGNTGLVGGSIPDDSGKQLVVQLGRMSAIRRLDPENLTVTVDAGCVLQSLQTEMRNEGYLFPLSLGAEGSCMIGGNLATNAGGTQVLRYGNARELCLGLEVVTADGDVWNGLSGLRKDNTGYDLRNLFIGSEGTLGIITAATMKIVPLPAAVLTAWVALPSLEKAVKLLGLAQRKLGANLTGFEVMNRFALELVAKHMPQFRIPLFDQDVPYWVLIECSDTESEEHARGAFERLLEAAFEEGWVSDAVIAESLSQAAQMWDIREHIALAQGKEGPNVKHDISIPISKIPAFVSATEAQLAAAIPGSRIINFGHLGDGNLHFNVQCPEGADGGDFLVKHEAEITNLVYKSVDAFDGSFSAEHGVGAIKVDKLQQYKCPAALRLMRSIKLAVDPLNIMNPGRVLPSAD
jgi:FAD/FMN-containing dehydrogenase